MTESLVTVHDPGMKAMLSDLSILLVKFLKSTEEEVNSYLFGNIEMIMPDPATNPISRPIVEIKEPVASRPSTPQNKPRKPPAVTLQGRTLEMFELLKKLLKAEKKEK